jgi:hypothetical protein
MDEIKGLSRIWKRKSIKIRKPWKIINLK